MRNRTATAAAVQELGETMATAPDRRVRRTRRALQDALVALMTEKGYEAVTVQDIIDRADVGRSTFYTHYVGKDELLQDSFARLRSILEQPVTTQSAGRRPLSFSLPLFRHAHEQQQLSRAVFSRPGQPPIRQQLDELLAGVVRAEFTTLLGADPVSRIPLEALVRYVVGACRALLEWWLTIDTAASPEDMDRIFQALVTPGIRAAIHDINRPSGARTAGSNQTQPIP
jgi:AcrR family transcriptional regulator